MYCAGRITEDKKCAAADGIMEKKCTAAGGIMEGSMDCFARAFRYLCRKRIKSLLLLFLFLVINSMVLGTLGIRAASLGLAEELRRNTESRVTLESRSREEAFDGMDYQDMMGISNVNWVNRITGLETVSLTLFPVIGDETSNECLSIHGYDAVEKDSPFADRVYRIIEGDYPHDDSGIVINQLLAQQNGIRLMDKVMFQTADGQKKEAVISGFFLSGTEWKQTENVATANRTENQIYAKTNFVNELAGQDSFVNASVYVKDPQMLEETESKLQAMYQDRAALSSVDHAFMKLKLMIGQVEKTASFIFVLTVLVGCSVAGLLLAMWTRNRKIEIAVFISLGISKLNIMAQMMLEGVLLYGISYAGALIIVRGALPEVTRGIELMQEGSVSMGLSPGGMVLTLGIGTVSVIALTGIAVFPYITKPLKGILSEMEG